MSRSDERAVAESLGRYLGVTFEGSKYGMAPWGEADDWARLGPNAVLLLEVETSQKHPSTNVLKCWPHLEDRRELRIVLGQVFFPDSPGLRSSRGRLGDWIGARMEAALGGRFAYRRLVASRNFEIREGLDALAAVIEAAVAGNREGFSR